MQTQIAHSATQIDMHEDFNLAKLPIDRESIRSRRLLRLIELVEVLRTPDNQRTIWQMLLDAGANPDFILLRDCDDDVHLSRRPAIQVTVNTNKHSGFVIITHNADDSGYRVLLQENGTSVSKVTVEKVIVRKLAEVLTDLIDDGSRRQPIPQQGLSTNPAIAGEYLLA